MGLLSLFDKSFFSRAEEEAVLAVGLALSKNEKIVSARTIRSLRAETIFEGDKAIVRVYGSEGTPFIIDGKPAGTKYPMDFVGTKKGKSGRDIKVFELKPKLKDWKALVGFDGPDFLLARAIAENPRDPIDIGGQASEILRPKIDGKILKGFTTLISNRITTEFKK